ncbi:hypothetical protein WKI71_04455 [Streptomyces sp. MS1.AVA.1]|uniref:Uncharacterized protein n=1 Tax=Streptomyces machairae TaxID=3134109 RepID=A0ABU8UGP2_9ACTN
MAGVCTSPGRPAYAYNYFGMNLYTVRGDELLVPGRHEIRLEFDYDGGGLGRGGTVVLLVNGEKHATGRVARTIPYYFSFDETLDVGVDLSTPVTDDSSRPRQRVHRHHPHGAHRPGRPERRVVRVRRGLHRRVMGAQ